MTEMTTEQIDPHSETHGSMIRQLVCFIIGNENFGVDISSVQEINRLVDVTRIPQAPDFVEGVINLRGNIIPVMDLGVRFGFTSGKTRDKENRIVVVDTADTAVGFIVDTVTQVLRIETEDIEPPPRMISSAVDIKYIEGVAKIGDQLLIVLNTDLIFSQEEVKSLASIN